MSNQLLAKAAHAYINGGLSIIPINHRAKRPYGKLLPQARDGEGRLLFYEKQGDDLIVVTHETGIPKGTWEPYQTTPPTIADADRWLAAGTQALAVVCGKVSGGVEILDFDIEGYYERWIGVVGELGSSLPVQRTGGGGIQVAWRCPQPDRNQKLAWHPDPTAHAGRCIAIETRGEGGYALLPPSLHPSGRRYELLSGRFSDIPHITQAERNYLLDSARSLCQAPRTRQEIERPAPTVSHREPYTGESVIDAYNAAHDIAQTIEHYGYTRGHGGRYSHPKNKASSGVIVWKSDNKTFNWSSNDALNSESHGRRQPRAPFDYFCEFEHKGDMRAAVKAAAIELGNEQKKTAPTEQTFTAHQWIYASQCWLVGADFAAIIPKHLQSAKGYRTAATDKRAFSAVLNVLGEYGKLNGPISNQQGHLRSGLSEGSFRNAMARLMEAGLVRRITPPEAMTDGAYWYELNTCVLCAVGVVKQVELPRAKYASVFDAEKTEDAWQRGGSKKQRAIATIKSAGPDLLLAVSVLAVGERIHQAALGKRMHMSEFATSRLVRKMQYFAIVSTECVGRQQYITLLPNWRETIATNTPSMPTYGNKFRRELNAHVRTGENCDRKLARGLGDKEKLSAKREEAARKAFAMMESEMAKQYTDLDVLSEKMRRLLRADSLRRVAATGEKTARTVEIAMHRHQQAKPWFSQSSPFEERRTERMMQELYDNELLIDAREQLKQGA